MTAAAKVKRVQPTFFWEWPTLMNSGLSERCTEAFQHLLKSEGRRRIPMRELGERVGALMGRKPYDVKVVSRWLSAVQEPENAVYLALAQVFGVDPGWLVFGGECAAPMVPSDDTLKAWSALAREVHPTRATAADAASRHAQQGKAAGGSRRRSPPSRPSARKGPR